LVRNCVGPDCVLDPATAGEPETPTLPLLEAAEFEVPVALAELVELDEAARLPEPALRVAAVL
jgi:hypothetical protein